jgi:flagellar hook-length control protein FliK
MFLAVSGGIVTAPVVQRTDTGSAPIINAPLNVPLTNTDADAALAGNVRWMVNEGVQHAVVTVSPSGMGPISVKIGIDQDQLNVSIVAAQGSTREALDALLPRLRDQLASLGHDSVRVDVSDGRGEQSRAFSGQGYTDSRNASSEGMQNSQDNDNSTSNREQAEPRHPHRSAGNTQDSAPGELQQVASGSLGLAADRPAFDAYV